MTKKDAYILLGISRTAGLTTAERAYRQKCKECRMKILPGNPVAIRQKTQEELARLTTAWHTVQIVRPRKAKKNNPVKPAPLPKTMANKKTPDLADCWDFFFSMLPLPRPLVTTFAVMAIAATMFFIHQYMKGN